MIQNIQDRKKNLKQRQDSDFSGYLTEEALAELIEHVETREMLHAPGHLKENVMEQLKRERRSAKNRQMFVYRAKVFVAMAAALTLLILMPDDRTEKGGRLFTEQQAQEVTLEQIALQRHEDMDANWEKYLAERESDGVRGFFRSINERITELAGLHDSDSIDGNKADVQRKSERHQRR